MVVKYILKLCLFLSPALFVVAVYIIKDPFKVLYHYDCYLPSNKVINVEFDKDYVSTENFLNKYDKFHYDSYIFGNSKSMYYHIDTWRTHVSGESFYHFDASGENLMGVERKLALLEKKGVKIKNALFVIDEDLLGGITNPQSIALIKHPILSGQSKLEFQLFMFKSYADMDFLSCYMKLLATGKYVPSMSKTMVNHILKYVDTTNEETFPTLEDAILRNEDSFYTARKDVFFKRTGIVTYSKACIDTARERRLKNMKRILDANNTNYKIVISPSYDQVSMNRKDLENLQAIFGANNVFDFSGINDFTNNVHNYYEQTHYRPFIAKRIMDSVYKQR